jgi:hypothetical protein
MVVKLPTTQQFQRISDKPLDPSFYFENRLEAQDYIYTSPIAYEGQLIFIKDARTDQEKFNDTVKVYSGYFYIGRNNEICSMCDFTIDKINDLLFILSNVLYKKDMEQDLADLENELLKKVKK